MKNLTGKKQNVKIWCYNKGRFVEGGGRIELNNEVYEEINRLCDNGDSLFYSGNLQGAIAKYKEALEILPEPKNKWEISTWIYGSLADTYFLNKEYTLARLYFYEAIDSPDGLENSFILMRLGQCEYEHNNKDIAKKFFKKAYSMEGYYIFQKEDPKYFSLIAEEC